MLFSFYCLAAEYNGCEKKKQPSLIILKLTVNLFSWKDYIQSILFNMFMNARIWSLLVQYSYKSYRLLGNLRHKRFCKRLILRPPVWEMLNKQKKNKNTNQEAYNCEENQSSFCLDFSLLSKQELLQSFFLCSFSRKEWGRVASQNYGNTWLHILGNHSSLRENDCKDACT